MPHYELNTPVSEDEVRALRVNDTVTLQRTLFGIRDATLIHLFDRGRSTRLDLRGHAVITPHPTCARLRRAPTTPSAMRRCASARRRAIGWSASPTR
jgi:L(+)-tartrate dehydratase beta subunit